MSSVSKRERERELILEFLVGHVSEDDFYRELPIRPDDVSELGLVMLRRAVEERDPVDTEFGLSLGHRFGISQKYLDVLLVLAGEGWHERHEDVVDGLAKLRAPVSVDTLCRTALAKYPYLDYDDAYALGVKCIYALGNIQTLEAVIRLGELLRCGNSVLESEAAAQLARIGKVGKSEAVRAAAREALVANRSAGADK